MNPQDRTELLEALSRKLADEGKLIEAGWVGYRLRVIHPDAPEIQIRETRLGYMAGAQHLFASIMTILEPGAEPTDADLQRLTLIHEELENFVKELKQQQPKPPNPRNQ